MLTFESKGKQGFKTFAIVRGFEDKCFCPVLVLHYLQWFTILSSLCLCVYIPCFLFLHIGYQHLKEVAVCDCESHAVTWVRCQFWPGSPDRPSVGFHFKLIDLAEKLFLHSQVSVKKFSEFILEMTPPLQPNFVSSFIITVVFFIRPVFFNILIDFLVWINSLFLI